MEPQASSSRSASRWLPVIASLVVIACTGLIVYLVMVLEPAEADRPSAVEALVGAARPRVVETTVISTALSRLQDEAKLVVLTAETDARVSKISEKSTIWGIDLGQSRVDLWASGNKVQYVLPLAELDERSAYFDADRNVLSVTVPPPALDEQMVEVQSNPEKIRVQTELGWARLDRYSGQFLRREARKDLRPAVIEQGRSALLLERARNNAEILLEEELREKLAGALPPDADIEVVFR